MSSSLNEVRLLGNLGADPDTIKGGIAFRMATSQRWTDDDGRTRERTDWHRVCTFGRRAEALAKMLRKGSRVLVCGALRVSAWETDSGEKRTSVDVIASDVILCDPAPESARRGHNDRPAEG